METKAATPALRAQLTALLGDSLATAPDAIAPLVDAYLSSTHVGASEAARCIEFSVRLGGGRARGGRLLLERVAPPVADALAAVLGIGRPAAVDACIRHSAPGQLLVGWDVGGSRRIVKAYVGAVDRAAPERARQFGALATELGCRLPTDGEPPHLVGINVDAASGDAAVKLYFEGPVCADAAAPLGDRARALADLVARHGCAAGAVVCYDADASGLRPRAVTAGLAGGAADALVGELETAAGAAPGAVARALPALPRVPTFVGVSLTGAAERTFYARPLLDDAAPPRARRPEALLAVAPVFRAGDAEVAIDLAPHDDDARAYATVGAYDVSYRVRAGAPTRDQLVALMSWVIAQLEAAGEELDAIARRLSAPPPPWSRSAHLE